MSIVVLVGTIKGAFLLRSDAERTNWSVEGPLFKGWKVTCSARDASGRYYVGTSSFVYGATIHTSRNLVDWEPFHESPQFADDVKAELKQFWFIDPGDNEVFVGVDDAGLFSTNDDGKNWKDYSGLNRHRTRESWFPGFGGLCAHSFLRDPKNPTRLWCGISAVGVFRSDDGGDTWEPKNDGVPIIIEDEKHKDIGYCVHSIKADPDDADRIWRQDHKGMYMTEDGGDTWRCIEEGLPSSFGFPLAIHEPTKHLFASPAESDEYRMCVDGKLAIWRSRDGGEHWETLSKGLPDYPMHTLILRKCMAADGLTPGGVYAGTTAGTMHVSPDGGDSWVNVPAVLPRILSVEVYEEN